MPSASALACPASLKGVLSARQAAAALAQGFREGGAEAVELPVADGGEGTLEALHAALGGEWREADVSDAFGRPRTGRWLALGGGGYDVYRVVPRSWALLWAEMAGRPLPKLSNQSARCCTQRPPHTSKPRQEVRSSLDST